MVVASIVVVEIHIHMVARKAAHTVVDRVVYTVVDTATQQAVAALVDNRVSMLVVQLLAGAVGPAVVVDKLVLQPQPVELLVV